MNTKSQYWIKEGKLSDVSQQQFEDHLQLPLEYATVSCPVGLCFVALWHDALCQVAFVDSSYQEQVYLEELTKQWQISEYEKNTQKINQAVESFFGTSDFSWQGLVQGSSFDKKVWQALLQIPYGETVSYLELSQMVDPSNPQNFVRAVGGAVGRNLLGGFVPCHRVVYNNGNVGKYRYGSHHKQKLLAWEKQNKTH